MKIPPGLSGVGDIAARGDSLPSADDELDDGGAPYLEMSTKQLAQAIRKGQRLTFQIFDSDDVIGYIGGEDDEYFFVLEPTHTGFRKKLIRKSANPVIEIHDGDAYEREPFKDEMERIIHRYRSWVTSNIITRRPRRTSQERVS